MDLPDVNVLVNAFRSDVADHERCLRWLDTAVNGPSRYGMSPQVLASVVRVGTNRRIFREPSGLDEVLAFCEAVLSQPHCVVVQPGDWHWRLFRQLCLQADARGNLAADAWFAALAIESGCQWVSLDRDFARFPGLRWRLPD